MLPLLISLSVLGLFAGAALVALGRLRPGSTSALEGLALGMLPALVLVRLLPHAYESLGAWTLVLAAVGFGMVTLSHHAGERAEDRLGGALVMPALLLHAVTDGAALAMANSGRVGESASLLAAAVILHRVPEGLFVASRRQGARAREALLSALPLAVATIAGAVLGQRLFNALPDTALDAVLALGAGAMLRLVSHSHDQPQPTPTAARLTASTLFLCGVALVIVVPGPDDVLQRAQPREFPVARSIVPLFIESAPAVLLGLLLTAALRSRARLPPRATATAAGALWQALFGWAGGVAQQPRLVELPSQAAQLRRAGGSAAFISGMSVAATQLGVDTAALSVAWLGPYVTLARAVGSLSFALLAGAVCAQLAPSRGSAAPAQRAQAQPRHAVPARRAGLWELAQRALDDNAAWLVLGLLLSAALEAALTPGLMRRLPGPWHGALAAALALLGRASAFGATPVVAVLLHKGLTLGAGLSLLWLSPLASAPLALFLGRRLSLTGVVSCAAAAALLSTGLGAMVERVLTKQAVPELHPLVMHEHAPWEYGCAALLAALLLRSLIRLGPRDLARSLAAAQPAHTPHPHPHPPAIGHRVTEVTLATPPRG